MKLNKKGITLVEIIVAIALISIVLLLLSMLLLDVKDINDKTGANSIYMLDKVILTKKIEDDLIKADSIKISETCDIKSIYSKYDPDNPDGIGTPQNKFNECIKLTLYNDEEPDDSDKTIYLGVYYYNTSKNPGYVISYIYDISKKETYRFNQFEKYNVDSEGNLKNEALKMNIMINNQTCYYDKLSECSITNNAVYSVVINIPMIGYDGKDYTISIPFYGKVSKG